MNTAQRYNGAIALIKSQTNYSEEEAKIRRARWNYMNVIKEYLNPNFRNKKQLLKKSVNERMMYEIRNFMDTAENLKEERLKRKKNKNI